MHARFPDGTERRAGVEVRAVGRRLEGYAAVYSQPATIGGFTEVIAPGAFRSAVSGAGEDVLCLVDHDPTRLLARRSSGTLRLSSDNRGLAFALDVPNTQLGHDVLELAERRDLGGMSFGFRAIEEHWSAPDRRELRSVELLEISVVQAWPAYSQTTVAARGRLVASPAAAAVWRRRILESM